MKISLDQAIFLLKKGEVIATPTETVYGLACCFDNQSAIEKIYEIKGRPLQKALTVNVASYEQILPFLAYEPKELKTLAELYWPGPLTLVLQIKPNVVLPIVTADSAFCGFRIPAQKELLKLLKEVGPIVLPSANPSSLPSAKCDEQVESYFGKEFPILDTEGCQVGVESTVLLLTDQEMKILREGAIKSSELLKTTNNNLKKEAFYV